MLELRLDSPDGMLIGQLLLSAPSALGLQVQLETEVSGAQGIHDIYFVFTGAFSEQEIILLEWKFI
ncbi:hypothetical protein HPL003_21325 [Paenibacillus terrae HPL-003]|uniref:Uncharacterized protein n=1 Tax=Paenibacillus terrae (strain HPL-003) TaxID=985665 RepID=G7VPJ7_PAETH|nr:hypothetical protein HPL003_21325 [Paenibacillus terrae HPL-003]